MVATKRVRIPVEFELPGDEAIIRDGDGLAGQETPGCYTM